MKKSELKEQIELGRDRLSECQDDLFKICFLNQRFINEFNALTSAEKAKIKLSNGLIRDHDGCIKYECFEGIEMKKNENIYSEEQRDELDHQIQHLSDVVRQLYILFDLKAENIATAKVICRLDKCIWNIDNKHTCSRYNGLIRDHDGCVKCGCFEGVENE